MSESAAAALRSAYRDWEWTPVRSWPGRETWRLVHPDGRAVYLKVAAASVALIDDGGVTWFIDLGEISVADRWWDLATATWNLGPGWDKLFPVTYGVAPDHKRGSFYRLLYDLVA